jgi:hypothetical protein
VVVSKVVVWYVLRPRKMTLVYSYDAPGEDKLASRVAKTSYAVKTRLGRNIHEVNEVL